MRPREVPTKVSSALVGALDGRDAWFQKCTGTGRTKNHSVYVVPDVGSSVRFSSFADTSVNATCALLERVFYHEIDGVFQRPHRPSPAVVANTLRKFANAISRLHVIIAPVANEDFSRLYYSGRKRAVYEKAYANLCKRGSKRSDSYLDTFIKHEKILESAKRAVPRVIQPRKPEYNLLVGCFLKPLEHVLYGHIATVFGRPTVMKGYNAFQVGGFFHETWDSFHDPCAIGLDASRFDQHVSVPLLRWEHQQYLKYFNGSSVLANLLRAQLHNRGFVRSSPNDLHYKIAGGRCSGDMNTAMGNCLLMCAMVHSLIRESGVHQSKRSRVALFNNGDDCVLMGERSDLLMIKPHVVPFFEKLGFVMKVEAMVDVLEQVSFCQTSPIYDGANWRMVRDPRMSLSKDATIIGYENATRHLSNHLLQLGTCGLSLTWGIPLLQSYYSALRRGQHPSHGYNDEAFKNSGFYQMSLGLSAKWEPVSDAARVSFYRAFGIVPDLQIEAEKYYDKLEVVPAPVQCVDLPIAPLWW